MTSDINNMNDNSSVDNAEKKRLFLIRWKAIECVAFVFFLIGLLTTCWVGSRFYFHFLDKQYEETGDNWESRRDGSRALSDLEIITFKRANVSDAELDSLVGRPDIAAVYLIDCPNISDACLESLSQIPNLRRLVIERCDQLENPDFSKLSRLKQLKRLSVRFCSGLTDESVEKISRLHSLKILHMTGCSRITPKVVSQLRSLPLVEFAPPECVLTDETIVELLKFKRLRCLAIAGNDKDSLSLTDKGVLALSKMKKIQYLWIEDCPNVSDDSLSELASIVNSRRGMWDLELEISTKKDNELHVSGFTFDDYRTQL